MAGVFFKPKKIKMKIKLLKSFSGENGTNSAGSIIEVSEAKGERLISLKCAEEVQETKKIVKDETTKKVSDNKSTSNRTGNTKRSKGASKK